MIKINITYISLLFFLYSCTNDFSNNSTDEIEILNTFVHYTYDADSNYGNIYAQLTLNDVSPNEIDSIWIDFEDVEGNSHHYLLDGGNSENEFTNNGIYNLSLAITTLENGVYDIIFYVSSGISYLLKEESLVVGLYPPVVKGVLFEKDRTNDILCNPDTYSVSSDSVDIFYIYLLIQDLNGFDDIKTIKIDYKKESDYFTPCDPLADEDCFIEMGDCHYNMTVDGQEFESVGGLNFDYIDDPSILYQNDCSLSMDELENTFLYRAGLTINGFDGAENCGPSGSMTFRYTIRDYSNSSDSIEHTFKICWPAGNDFIDEECEW